MKLRTIVKIAITSSVVLLCAGFALYSYFRLSATENRKDFNLYTLVPLSASTIFATDDASELVLEIDELTCSKNQQYLHVSRLFSALKQYFYTILEDAPHGLSRQMNQVLISFHEPYTDDNQVMYCTLGAGDRQLVRNIVREYASSGYPVKNFNYKGEDIDIYPMADGSFLACYLTRNFMVLSYQKRLIEEVIDAYKNGSSLASDSTFTKVCVPKKSEATATIYARLDGMIGWTEFDMKLKDDFIYLSGVSHDVDTCRTFTNVLRQQEAVKGFPGETLPSTAFYFSRQGATDWPSLFSLGDAGDYSDIEHADEVREWDKQLSRYLIENTRGDLIACLFQRDDSLAGSAAVLSLSVSDAVESERMLRTLAGPASATLFYTVDKAYSVYQLPQTTLFGQLAHFTYPLLQMYAVFYGGRLLMAPDSDSLSRYIRQLEAGEVLNGALTYQTGTDGLSDTYHFMLMADFNRISGQPEKYARLIPPFFFQNSEFFRHFILFAQFSCADGVVYPNIVLRYKND